MNNKLPPQEPMVSIPIGLDCRENKWTQKQIDEIERDAEMILSKLRPLPRVKDNAHEWRESTAQCLVKLEDFPLYAEHLKDDSE